jgi:hypothetical protein
MRSRSPSIFFFLPELFSFDHRHDHGLWREWDVSAFQLLDYAFYDSLDSSMLVAATAVMTPRGDPDLQSKLAPR